MTTDEPGPPDFAPADWYATCLAAPAASVIREAQDGAAAVPFTERTIQCIWFDAAHRPSELCTSAGEEVRVEDPGQWNLEAGPDFLNATLVIGPERRKVQGDVEIHIRPSDWHNHGHSHDPAYARVMAHVTYFPGPLPNTALPGGAVQIALRSALKADPSFAFESVDVAAYPYASLTGTTRPCRGILAGLHPNAGISLLEAAGAERLKRKAARMAVSIAERGADQALYEEVMAALGYKHNRIPFRHLARRVPLHALREEADGDSLRAYALLMGVSGLLPAKPSPEWDAVTRAFVRSLWDRWWKQQSRWIRPLPELPSWRLSGLRPQNHPSRRLAAAAVLFTHPLPLSARLQALDAKAADTWYTPAEAVFGCLQGLPFWDRRLGFSAPVQPSGIALIGPQRVAAILSNIAIPFLSATGVPVSALLSRLPPEDDNALVRQMLSVLFGRDHNPALFHQGLRQQGLLQIFYDFCIRRRPDCRNCPLPDALERRPPTAAA